MGGCFSQRRRPRIEICSKSMYWSTTELKLGSPTLTTLSLSGVLYFILQVTSKVPCQPYIPWEIASGSHFDVEHWNNIVASVIWWQSVLGCTKRGQLLKFFVSTRVPRIIRCLCYSHCSPLVSCSDSSGMLKKRRGSSLRRPYLFLWEGIMC